jgi:hypothetical protein
MALSLSACSAGIDAATVEKFSFNEAEVVGVFPEGFQTSADTTSTILLDCGISELIPTLGGTLGTVSFIDVRESSTADVYYRADWATYEVPEDFPSVKELLAQPIKDCSDFSTTEGPVATITNTANAKLQPSELKSFGLEGDEVGSYSLSESYLSFNRETTAMVGKASLAKVSLVKAGKKLLVIRAMVGNRNSNAEEFEYFDDFYKATFANLGK